MPLKCTQTSLQRSITSELPRLKKQDISPTALRSGYAYSIRRRGKQQTVQKKFNFALLVKIEHRYESKDKED